MARYIKANPKVAQYLGLTGKRNRTPDGNYLLWQADMLKFGSLTQLSATLEEIGGVALQPSEARKEQDGVLVHTLPTATNSIFVTTTTDEVPDEAETEEVADELS